MNTVLWVMQIILALLFLMAGGMKVVTPYAQFIQKMPWGKDLQPRTIKAVGVLEVLGALGLVLPGLLNFLPTLIPYAAAGLAVTMIGAAWLHVRRKERQQVVVNFVLMAVALLICVGRFVFVPLGG